MSVKDLALRLADELQYATCPAATRIAAMDELRRLHARVAELEQTLGAARNALNILVDGITFIYGQSAAHDAVRGAKETIVAIDAALQQEKKS